MGTICQQDDHTHGISHIIQDIKDMDLNLIEHIIIIRIIHLIMDIIMEVIKDSMEEETKDGVEVEPIKGSTREEIKDLMEELIRDLTEVGIKALQLSVSDSLNNDFVKHDHQKYTKLSCKYFFSLYSCHLLYFFST